MSRSTRTAAQSRILRLWWLNPAWLFAAVIGVTALVAFLQSDAGYQKYGTYRFFEAEHLLLAAGAILVFGLGARLASAAGGTPQATPPEADRIIRFWFWLSFGLSVFGYVVWAGVGIKNGVSLDMLGGLVTDADTYAAEESVRKELFPTIPGVTTCSQFGVAAVLLGLWLFVHGDRRVLWPMGVVLGLALMRALLWRERTAVLAFAVPAFAIWLRVYVLNRPWSPLARSGLQLGPVFGVVLLLLFFGGFEYFRSWRIYHHEFSSYLEFTLWRLGGYFTAALNNGAMALQTQEPLPLPFWTLRPFWEFPGVETGPISYHALTGVDPSLAFVDMLELYGTVEYNNEGGLFMPYVDYGLLGFFAFWFGCGYVSGRLYRSFLAGTLAGLTLYPIIFLAVLKTPLILFIFFPAMLPPQATLLVVLWLVRRQTTRAQCAGRLAVGGPLWGAVNSPASARQQSQRGYPS